MAMAADLAAMSRAAHNEMTVRLDRIEDRLNASQVITYRPWRANDE
jgi:hypothetical protein